MGQKLKQSKPNIYQAITASSIGLLIILVLALVCPGAGYSANAADGPFSAEAGTIATAHIPSVLSVSLGSSVDMTIAPSWSGSFTSSQTALSVTTNNPTGYQIFLETADGTQNLNPVSLDNTQKITPIVGTASKNNFANNINAWGYVLLKNAAADDNTEYSAIPLTGSTAVQKTNTTANNDTYNLSFAAIVSAHLPVDTYTNQVIVTVIANPAIATASLSDSEINAQVDESIMEEMENE